MSISPLSWLPVISCVFGSHAPDGRDLPSWLKDFDRLGLQLLGRRPNPVVNGSSWQIEDAVAPVPRKSSSTRLSAAFSAPPISTRPYSIWASLPSLFAA